MKGLKNLITRRPLTMDGIAHFVLPLAVVLVVGVIGTFVLVSTHADAATRKGYIVVSSNQGAFDSVKIQLTNAKGSTHSCGGSLNNSTTSVVKTLPGADKKTHVFPTPRYSCTPINGDGSYQITYGANKDFSNAANMVAVDVDAGYCTYVYPQANLISKAKANSNGSCPKSSTNDAPVKTDVALRVLPKLINSAKGQTIGGFVEVAYPNNNVTRSKCTGDLALITHNDDSNTAVSVNLPLKFVGGNNTRKSYCVAKIAPVATKPVAGHYTLTAQFPGNLYFNAGSASYKVNVAN